LLKDTIKADLEWLEQEFTLLFKQKQLKHCYSKNDISVGNQILDNVIEKIKNNESEEVLNLLAITLNSLEKSYPVFFE
jgi:hypothetical protein